MQCITSPAGTRLAKATAALDLSFERPGRTETAPGSLSVDQVMSLCASQDGVEALQEFMDAAREVGAELMDQNFHKMEDD